MATRNVAVRLYANTDQYKQQMGQATLATSQFSASSTQKVSKVGGAFTAVGSTIKSLALPLAGAAVGKFFMDSIDAASNLEESINAVRVTFGDAADDVLAIGETAATSFGLSKRAFNESAVAFAAFADTIAGPGGDVASTIDDLMLRATDFASVMNLEVNDAMALFRSTLAGESEPIRRFGMDVSAAAVEQYALANGLVQSSSEMTEAIKVQARYGLLMQETAGTAGDFANTQGGLANQQRILTANIEDLQAAIGERLVPALANATQNLNRFLEVAEKLKLLDLAFAIDGWQLDGLGRLFGVATGEADIFGRQVHSVTDEQFEFVRAAKEMGLTSDEVNQALAAGVTTMEEYTAMQAEQAAASDELSASSERLASWMSTAAATTEEAAKAQEEYVNSVLDAISSTFDYESAVLALEDSMADYLNKAVETEQIVADSTKTDMEKEAALRDLRQEEIRGAEQALETARAYATQQGAAEGSAESANLQIAKLQELATEYPHLRGEIGTYISELGRIPGSVTTNVYASTGAALRSLGELEASLLRMSQRSTYIPVRVGTSGGVNTWMANGGIVDQPTLSWVGEAGKEVIIPLTRPERAMELAEQSGLLNLIGSMSAVSPVSMPTMPVQSSSRHTPNLPTQLTLIIEGRPFTAMLAEHDRELVGALYAGERER